MLLCMCVCVCVCMCHQGPTFDKYPKIWFQGRPLLDDTYSESIQLDQSDCWINSKWFRNFTLFNWYPNGERYGIDERECQTPTYRELIRRSDLGDDSIRNCLITLDFKIVSTQYYIYEHFMKWKMPDARQSWFFWILLQMQCNAMQCISYFGILISKQFASFAT